jgi:hypothetical protein
MQFLFAFTSNGFVNHMRANRQPLLHLLLLDARVVMVPTFAERFC